MNFAQWIAELEAEIGRPLSDEEKASIGKSLQSLPANNPLVALGLILANRQGTQMPDFDAFYAARAKFDDSISTFRTAPETRP